MDRKWVGLVLGIFVIVGVAWGQQKSAPPAEKPSGQTSGVMASPYNSAEVKAFWNPTVGEGEVYEITDASGKKRTEEFNVISTETVSKKIAFWMGFSEELPGITGKVYGKTLVVPEDSEARKLILQLPGMGAMDIPVLAGKAAAKVDEKDEPKLVGTETITVPAGKFECEHWRGTGETDVWLSAKVGPSKIVKRVSEDETRVLVKTEGKVKDPVTGPVKAYDEAAFKKAMAKMHGG